LKDPEELRGKGGGSKSWSGVGGRKGGGGEGPDGLQVIRGKEKRTGTTAKERRREGKDGAEGTLSKLQADGT